jgi:hypothetical protein
LQVNTGQGNGEETERVPGVVLHGGLPDAEHLRGKPGLEAVRAERAQPDRDRGEQCAESEEQLQAGFLVFFLTRCGRFLP